MENDIKNNLAEIRARIAEAAAKAGRNAEDVRLVAVSKTVSLERVRQGIEAGLTLLGENYIQEATGKIEVLKDAAEWHFIGHLQSNKAKFAVQLFDMVHSVDSLKLARSLGQKALAAERTLPVLVQVNISGEASKSGVEADDAERLIEQVAAVEGLAVKGLMTMPPFFDQPENARPFFASLRKLKEKIGPPLSELSMGMSGDFEVAIEEGATLVRIGTAIFGERKYT